MFEYEFGPSIWFERQSFRESSSFRGVINPVRAAEVVIRELRKAILFVQEQRTKTVGDAHYRLRAFLLETLRVFEMSDKREITVDVRNVLGKLNTRSGREEAISLLKALLSEFESFLERHSLGDDGAGSVGTHGAAAKLVPIEELSQQQSVFVIMPFSESLNDVWRGGIRPACNALKLKPIRVDDITQSTNITDDIVSGILKCHLCVVDVTGLNPNVMFELGYAMAREKSIVMIGQSTSGLPFDIRNTRIIEYENSWSGIEKLREKLIEFLRTSAPKGYDTGKSKKK